MKRSLACSTKGLSGLFKVIAVGAVACATCLVPSIAMACGGDSDVVNTGIVRPVISFPNQAQSLFAAAADLDQRATTMDTQAATFVQRASEANVDARALRIQAASSEDATERAQLFQLANQLGTQASLETQTAIDLRRQATQLREQARIDRLRANQITTGGSGGGWRGRPIPKSTQARI